MVGNLAQLGAADARVCLTGRPADDEIEGFGSWAQTEFRRQLVWLQGCDVPRLSVLRISLMEVQRMGARSQLVDLNGRVDPAPGGMESERYPPAAREQVKDARHLPACKP
jgi:hypothetical protein